MNVTPADIRTVPLFRDITDEHLAALMKAFERATHPAGHTLFSAGEVPARFLLLVRGEVTVTGDGDARGFVVRAIAPIGELGSLSGIPRNTTAVVSAEAEIWSIALSDLMAFFERHGDIAFPFYHNLLGVVSDKIRRDRRRMDEMRANIVRTQKAMKRLRELVLDGPETPISQPVFEALDELIEKNRRAHYRVAPTPRYPAWLRLDDGTRVDVLEVSDGYLKLAPGEPRVVGPNNESVGVLCLPTGEILVSGRVERKGPDGVVVALDELIDAYRAQLEDYVTRVQLLDYVV